MDWPLVVSAVALIAVSVVLIRLATPASLIAPPVAELSSLIVGDLPITSAAHDLLGRAPFAERLADVVSTSPAESGLIVGLAGRWGDGKTSTLKLVKEKLETERWSGRIRVIEFNPWLWTGTGQLVAQFFNSLSRAVPSERGWPDWLAPMLRDYGASLSFLSLVDTPVSTTIGAAGGVSQALAILAQRWRRVHPDDLTRWRAEMVAALARGPMRLVVMVDDLDRLGHDELVDVMRLLKLIADFPNVVYLLAYDRDQVAKALAADGGRAYLEKIVQIDLNLPEPEPARLDQLRFATVTEAIKPLPQRLWNSDRFVLLYRDGLHLLLQTVRDVKRFLNAVNVAVAEIGPEVNGVDLLGITAIRLFAPELYRSIHEAPDLFVGGRFVLDEKTERSQRKEVFEARLQLADTRVRDPIAAIARVLFPRIDDVYTNTTSSDKVFTEDLRISGQTTIARYFTYRLPSGEVSERQVDELFDLAGSSDVTRLERALAELLGAVDQYSLLTRIRLRVGSASSDVATRMASAELNLWESLSDEWRGFLELTPRRVAGLTALDVLRETTDQEKRQYIAGQFVRAASIDAAISVGRRIEDEKDERVRLDPEHFSLISGLLAQRLTSLTDEQILEGNPWRVLYGLKWWVGDNAAQEVAGRLTRSNEGLLRMLHRLVIFEHHSAGAGVRTLRKLDESALKEFLDPDQIRERAKRLYESSTVGAEDMKILELLLFPPAAED